jgi:hypothetical protein
METVQAYFRKEGQEKREKMLSSRNLYKRKKILGSTNPRVKKKFWAQQILKERKNVLESTNSLFY